MGPGEPGGNPSWEAWNVAMERRRSFCFVAQINGATVPGVWCRISDLGMPEANASGMPTNELILFVGLAADAYNVFFKVV